jgi:hypothetical protein
MTGPEHYAEAERLLALADRQPDLSPSWHPGSQKARFWLTARPRFLIFPARPQSHPE